MRTAPPPVIRRPRPAGFTLIELLVVITIILILAGLILSVSGYVQKRAALSRASAEVKALQTALESYKSDNGAYPEDYPNNAASVTDSLDANPNNSDVALNPATYTSASQFLYAQLTGYAVSGKTFGSDPVNNIQTPIPPFPPTPGGHVYFEFQAKMLGGNDGNGNVPQGVTSINDPFGYSYGYSTAYQGDVNKGINPPTHGNNPTYDLWSTGGAPTVVLGSNTAPVIEAQWITNW